MNKSAIKWIILSSAATIIFLYFFELTTSGLARMQGTELIALEKNQLPSTQTLQPSNIQPRPLTNSTIEEEIQLLEEEILELKRQALEKEKKELQQQLLLNEAAQKSNVNKVADSTSGVLQNLSSSGIQLVAEWFHNVIN